MSEPVAWIRKRDDKLALNDGGLFGDEWTPLYAHPPQREPLDEQEPVAWKVVEGTGVSYLSSEPPHPSVVAACRPLYTSPPQSAQPEQEPVAWMNEHGHIDRGLDAILDPTGWTPLYTAPPQRKPLDGEKLEQMLEDYAKHGDIVRAVERAHGIS